VAGAVLAGCARREDRPSPATGPRVGAFRVGVENKPTRPVVGDNTLRIAVNDSVGSAVPGAEVKVLVVMQAMGTMPRMESRGVVREAKPGLYEAAYGLSMAGEWDVDVSIRSREGAEVTAAYRLSTSTKKILFVSGTPAGAAGGAVASAPAAGVVLLDPARRQEIGVRTEPISKKSLQATIRAAGKVAYDETRRAEISLKFSGWVRSIQVDYTGRVVRRGEALLSVYSPELLAAQQEFLEALKAAPGAAATSGRDPELAAAARQRLLLWDITPEQIDAIAATGKPVEAIPIQAPVGGVVVEKNVVRGSSFMAGQML